MLLKFRASLITCVVTVIKHLRFQPKCVVMIVAIVIDIYSSIRLVGDNFPLEAGQDFEFFLFVLSARRSLAYRAAETIAGFLWDNNVLHV